MRDALLTKSKYLNGLQCPLYLWTQVHNPKELPEPDEATQYRFDEGRKVGELAKTLFPNGIGIAIEDFSKNLKESTGLLKKKRPLFEAAFSADRLYSRADILVPAGKDGWDIVEVKSSTKVKDTHIQDVAFQKHCYELAGLKIRKCFILRLNSEYVRKGEIDPKQIFVKEEITSDVATEMQGIGSRIAEMLKIIDNKTPPKVKIGQFCENPYECPLMKKCWASVPEDSVLNLYWSKKKAFELFEQGIVSLKDIPEDYELREKQQIQRNCAKTGKSYIDKKKLKEFIGALKCPLHFLDFETYATAIPLYDGLRPYENVPFQFSLHIVGKSGQTKHISFIARGSGDPRKAFMKKLKASIGKTGTVIVYYKSFEQSIMEQLAEFLPKDAKWVAQVIRRIADLYEPFRNFYYYSPKQRGSASLKAVLPAVTGKDYGHLAIKDGGIASVLYFYAAHGRAYGMKPSEAEVQKIFHDLEAYCGLDTEGMIWIVEKLRELVK